MDALEKIKERVIDYPTTITSEEIEYICRMYNSINTMTMNSICGTKIDINLIEYNQKKIIKTKEELNELLRKICLSSSTGKWLLSIKGITPYLAAKCISLFNVNGKECATQFLKYCGLSGQSTNFNKEAKSVVETIGNVFSRYGNYYRDLYTERLEYEKERNRSGEYVKIAEDYMMKQDTPTIDIVSFYSQGILPPTHIEHRAKIWVEKIFVCHLFTQMYYSKYHKLPKREREGGENNKFYFEPEVSYIQ